MLALPPRRRSDHGRWLPVPLYNLSLLSTHPHTSPLVSLTNSCFCSLLAPMAIVAASTIPSQTCFIYRLNPKPIPRNARHQLAPAVPIPPAAQFHRLSVLQKLKNGPSPRGFRCVASNERESAYEVSLESASEVAIGRDGSSPSPLVPADSAAKLEEAFDLPDLDLDRKQTRIDLEVGASQPLTNSVVGWKDESSRKIIQDGRENLLGKAEEPAMKRSEGGDSAPRLSEKWKEYHGENNWQGLLDPLDAGLRSEILKYGEFTQATYDAFDFDEHSKYCGSCRYNRHHFLEKVGLNHLGYRVTKYLYAMSDMLLPRWFRRSSASNPWSRNSNWMGYVAVATDKQEIARMGRRDIVIAWRGTVTFLEWLEDLDGILTPIRFNSSGDSGRSLWHELLALQEVRVQRGFLSLYTSSNENTRYNQQSASEQLKEEVRRLLKKYKGEELSITITGHSLGGALALLSAFDICASGLDRYVVQDAATGANDNKGAIMANDSDDSKIPVCVMSFGAPRVGNGRFKERLGEMGVKNLRVVNRNDAVPRVPGVVANSWGGALEKLEGLIGKPVRELLPWAYAHTGVEFILDNTHSSFLKPNGSLADYHNLEAYLHLTDGFHGSASAFRSVTGRDPALVNKSSNFLRQHLLIPPKWRQIENKGLTRHPSTGRWTQPDREPDDIPASYDLF